MRYSNAGRSRASAVRTGGIRLAAVVVACSCTSDGPLTSGPLFQAASVPARATGLVEIVWPGGRGREIPPGEEKLAFAEITIFDGSDGSSARGAFIYRVLNADGTLHREIVADITDAVVEYEQHKAWALGLVRSDAKYCSGSGGCDGHDGGDGGCGGDTGGCSGEDGTNHDDGGCTGGGDMGGGEMGGGDMGSGGCTGETGGCTGEEGGCSGGGETGGGGCTGETGGCTGEEGGCSGGGDMGGGDMGGGGCTGGETGGCSGDGHTGGVGGVPGNEPRVGQIVVIKLHDRGTPAFSDDGDDTNDDGITWKWFLAGTAPTIDTYATWSHLCKKSIIGGNLIVLPARP